MPTYATESLGNEMGLTVGGWVRATVTFTSDNALDAKEVPQGSLGKVTRLDHDGDALIAFQGDWFRV